MNKAFTANINDQVTARGYLDENNQLIMLEPEMSGGGGDYATAKLTIISESGVSWNCSFPYINNDGVIDLIFDPAGGDSEKVFDIPLGPSGTLLYQDDETVSITGNITVLETGVYKITGDATMVRG